jgi:hypothetical protein
MNADSLFTDDSSSFLTLPTSAFEEHVYVALWFLLFFVPYSYNFAPRFGLCVAWVVGVDLVMSKSVNPVNLVRLDDEEEDHETRRTTTIMKPFYPNPNMFRKTTRRKSNRP